MNQIPRPYLEFDPSDSGLSDQVALPDHYAMNTPEGEVGVGELSMRGLYAQRRFAWREAQWTPPPEPAFAEPQADPGWSASATDLAADRPETPVTGSDRVGDTDAAGEARIIDVESELASQAG